MGRRRSLVDKYNRADRKVDQFNDSYGDKLRDIDGKMDPNMLTPEERAIGRAAYRELSAAQRKLNWISFGEKQKKEKKQRRNNQHKRSQ